MRGLSVLAAAAAMSLGAYSMSERVTLPQSPTVGVERPPSKRRKDANYPKRKKPLARPRLLEKFGLAKPRQQAYRNVDRSRIVAIRQAVRAGGARVTVHNPERYLNSHARSMHALKRALAA